MLEKDLNFRHFHKQVASDKSAVDLKFIEP